MFLIFKRIILSLISNSRYFTFSPFMGQCVQPIPAHPSPCDSPEAKASTFSKMREDVFFCGADFTTWNVVAVAMQISNKMIVLFMLLMFFGFACKNRL